jgi:tetratricopeptide (TPR) repeat protein
VESLFHITGFASKQSTYAYLTAGSFSKYLIDRYGIEQFKKVFRSGNFVGVYAQSLTVCIAEWKEFLAATPCEMIPPETVSQLFSQPSIFRKTCARVTAETNRRGITLLRAGKFGEAEAEFASSVQDAKTPFALRGLFTAMLCQFKGAGVLAVYDAFDTRSLLGSNPSLLLLAGDACLQTGNSARAASLYKRVEDLHYSNSYIEAASLRRLAAADTALTRTFLRLTYGGMGDSARLAYLSARHDALRGQPASGVVAAWLGMEYRKTGDRAKAAVMFEQAAYALDNGTAKYETAAAAGAMFFDAGIYERALAMLWYANNFIIVDDQRDQIKEQTSLIEYVQRTMQE